MLSWYIGQRFDTRRLNGIHSKFVDILGVKFRPPPSPPLPGANPNPIFWGAPLTLRINRRARGQIATRGELRVKPRRVGPKRSAPHSRLAPDTQVFRQPCPGKRAKYSRLRWNFTDAKQGDHHGSGRPMRQQQSVTHPAILTPDSGPLHLGHSAHTVADSPQLAASSGSSFVKNTELARMATSRTSRPRAVTGKTSSSTKATTHGTSRGPSSSTWNPASSTEYRPALLRTYTIPRTSTLGRMALAPQTTGVMGTRRARLCARTSWR